MTKSFWDRADGIYQKEIKALEHDEDGPESPSLQAITLVDMVEELNKAIEKGDIEEARQCNLLVVVYCRILDDALSEWNYKDGLWWLIHKGDDFAQIWTSKGNYILIEAQESEEMEGRWDIHREDDDGPVYLETVFPSKVTTAINDYAEGEVEALFLPDNGGKTWVEVG